MEPKDKVLLSQPITIKTVAQNGKTAVTHMEKLQVEYYRTEDIIKIDEHLRPTIELRARGADYAATVWEELEAELCEYGQLRQTKAERKTHRPRFAEDQENSDLGSPVHEATTAIEESELGPHVTPDFDVPRYVNKNGDRLRGFGQYRSQRSSSSSETLTDSQQGSSSPLSSEYGLMGIQDPQKNIQLSPRSEEMCEYLRDWPRSTKKSKRVGSCDTASTCDYDSIEIDRISRSRRSRCPSRNLSDYPL